MIRSSLRLDAALLFAKKNIEPVMEMVGNIVLEKVNDNTPVRTGTLRDGNDVDVTEIGNTIVATVRNDVPYAKYVEFGTVNMEAQSFMRNGLVEAKNEIINIFGLK